MNEWNAVMMMLRVVARRGRQIPTTLQGAFEGTA
jgi:hypothetical protein